MRWFKHDTDARNDLRIKLLKKKHGAEGYGIYFQLIEIIGNFVEADNLDEWGYVDSLYNVGTLSEECGTTPQKLQEVLNYCDEIGLLQQLNGRLYCEKILKRLDDYAERIKAKNKGNKKVRTKSVQSPNTVGIKSDIDKIRIDKNIYKERIYIRKKALVLNENFNKIMTTSYKSIDHLLGNLEYWLKEYSLEEIIQAINKIPAHPYWKDKMNPTILLRQKNPQGEKVDYIGELLNRKVINKPFLEGYHDATAH